MGMLCYTFLLIFITPFIILYALYVMSMFVDSYRHDIHIHKLKSSKAFSGAMKSRSLDAISWSGDDVIFAAYMSS